MARITQISIFLVGPPEGANVTAVVYAGDPDLQFPMNGQVLARSAETLNVTSTSGEWYNFTMNFAPYGNETYWFGYYSDGFTRNFYNEEMNHATVISSGNSLPNTFSGAFTYSNSNMMSIYGIFERGNPNPAPTPKITPTPSPNTTPISAKEPTPIPATSPTPINSTSPNPTSIPTPSPTPTTQPTATDSLLSSDVITALIVSSASATTSAVLIILRRKKLRPISLVQ
jgi:hypothetical protein